MEFQKPLSYNYACKDCGFIKPNNQKDNKCKKCNSDYAKIEVEFVDNEIHNFDGNNVCSVCGSREENNGPLEFGTCKICMSDDFIESEISKEELEILKIKYPNCIISNCDLK